jgi:nitroimidazol reductase NimA-like FMN-containing flavoprotein (pyridoxamine 5'-phosphate oxidase superfamily)
MTQSDEPLFDSVVQKPHRSEDSPSMRDRVRRLLQEQPYAVLCTQGHEQPYGSIIAFAFTEDLKHAVFATPVTTRKYRLLSDCDHVALVIDNRSNRMADVMEIEAVTATGRACLVEQEGDFERWSDVLVARHPYLKSFVKAASCALFRVDVIRYFHVVRFQEVYQWSPNATS